MKVKTINRVIKEKMLEWIESIEDIDLRRKIKKEVIVTGGCIASMLLRERVNDFDVYFRTKETTKEVAEYYLKLFMKLNKDKFKIDGENRDLLVYKVVEMDDRIKVRIKSGGVLSESAVEGYRYFEMADPEDTETYVDQAVESLNEQKDEGLPYRPVFFTENAITLSEKVQIITRFFGSPKEIHDNYDFVHCTNYWTFDEGVVLNAEALECLLTKELRYVGSKYPFCSIVRTRKFIKRDWSVNAGQLLKMAFQLNQLNLNEPEVLMDQLIGVDIAYFHEILGLLREKMKEDGKKTVDATYLMEIIDRIF